MDARFRIAAAVGAVALVVVAWLLVRAGDGRGARAVEPVRVEPAPVAPEPEPASLPNQTRDSEPAPAERELVPVVEPESAKSDDAALGPDEALLIVDVVSAEANEPLPGVRLLLYPSDDLPTFRAVESSRAEVGESPITDSNGLAEFVCGAGAALTLSSHSEGFQHARIDVPALARGERRRVELRLRWVSDFVFHGRIVDAETGAPLPDAIVRRDFDHPTRLVGAGDPIAGGVGPDGRFRYPAKSWASEFLSASAPGHAVRVFMLGNEHDSSDRELVVALARSATLDCLVLDCGRAVASATVRLQADMIRLTHREAVRGSPQGRAPEWHGRTGVDGRTWIADLPPGVELRIAVNARGGAMRDEPARVVLDPGEERRITIDVGAAGAIAGRLLQSDGAAIAEAPVWLVAATAPVRTTLAYQTPAERTRTDERGRFRFDSVVPGMWWVGPGPDRGVETSREIAPLAEVVEVGTSEVYVEIRADVGLRIEGQVVAPDGAPVRGMNIGASRDAVRASLFVQTDESGKFRVGPLSAGTWQLTAAGHGYARSGPFAVEAGTRDFVVRLLRGASIEGRILSITGAAVSEFETISTRVDAPEAPTGQEWRNGDTFRFGGLCAGTYVVVAKTADGQFGATERLVVAEGQRVDSVTISVEPAERLTIRNGEDGTAVVRLMRDRAIIGYDAIAARNEGTSVVPPGELTIEARWPGDATPQTQTVTIARGETKEIVLKRSQ